MNSNPVTPEQFYNHN